MALNGREGHRRHDGSGACEGDVRLLAVGGPVVEEVGAGIRCRRFIAKQGTGARHG